MRRPGVPAHPRSPLPLVPCGARRPEDLAVPLRGSRGGNREARWARSRALRSPSRRRGHPECADRVKPLSGQGAEARSCRRGLGSPLSAAPPSQFPHLPKRITSFLPGRRAAIVELAPSCGRTARRCSRRPRVPGCVGHRHPRACIPRCLAGVCSPGPQSPAAERALSQLSYWSPSGIWKTPKFLVACKSLKSPNTLCNSLTDGTSGN